MKYNGKLVVYKYESVEKLLSDLMDSTEDKEIYERGLIRGLFFRVPMEKVDIERFYEDLNNHPNLFTTPRLKSTELIGPNGISFKPELVENE